MGLYKLPKRFHPDFAYPNVKPRGKVKLDRENKYGARMLFYGIVVEGGLYDVVGDVYYPLPNATFEDQHGDLVARYSGTFSDTLTLVDPVPWQEDAGILGEKTVGLRGSRLTQGVTTAIGKMANVHTDQGAVDERVEFDTQQNFGTEVYLYNSHQKGKFSWNQWDNIGLGNDNRPLERLTNMATSTYSYPQDTTPYEHGAISYVNGVYVAANEGSHGGMPHTGFTTIIMGNTDSDGAHVCVSNVWIAEGLFTAEDHADFDLDVWQALAPATDAVYAIPAAGGGPTPITGACSITATPTSSLTGVGVLSATSSIVATVTGILKGIGVLTTSVAAVFTPTSVLKGVGVLAGSIAPTFLLASTLTGVGVLDGSATVTFTPSSGLTGKGVLDGSVTGTFTPSSGLTGKGVLTAATSGTFSPTSGLTGVGVLTGTSPVIFSPTSTLVAAVSDAITGSASITFSPTSGLTGVGVLDVSTSGIFNPTSTLTGTGQLDVTSAITFSPTSSLTGTGVLTGASTVVFTPTASLDAIGVISGSASVVFTPTSSITGTGVLTGASSTTFTPTSSIVDGASPAVAITGSASITFTPTSGLTGVGVLADTIAIAFTPGIRPLYANLLTYPEDFTHSDWLGAPQRVADQAIAPDGSLTADELEDDSITNSESIYQNVVLDPTKRYTASVYIKKDAVGRADRFPMLRMSYRDGGDTESNQVKLDTFTGDVNNGNNSIDPVFWKEELDDYWRIGVSATPDDQLNTQVRFQIWPAVGEGTPSWPVDQSTLGTITAWGAQLTESDSLGRYFSGFVGIGSLAGTTGGTFSPSGTLDAIGVLTGSSSSTFTSTGTLTGVGSITGTASATFTPSSDITGIGSLTGSCSNIFSPTAALTGRGQLTGSTTIAFSPTSSLTGVGVLAGTTTGTFTCTSTLTEAPVNQVTGSSSIIFTATANLTGIGFIVGISTILATNTGTVRDGNAGDFIPGPPIEVLFTELIADGQPILTQAETFMIGHRGDI